jgi:hypothetical protein
LELSPGSRVENKNPKSTAGFQLSGRKSSKRENVRQKRRGFHPLLEGLNLELKQRRGGNEQTSVISTAELNSYSIK